MNKMIFRISDIRITSIIIVIGMFSMCQGQPIMPRPGGAGMRVPMMSGGNNVPVPFRPNPRRPIMPNALIPGGTNVNTRTRQLLPGNRNTGTIPPANPSNTGPTCSARGRAVITQCFQTNAGVQMQQVVGLLSNGSQAPLPTNADRLKARICIRLTTKRFFTVFVQYPQDAFPFTPNAFTPTARADDRILACIYAGVNALRNSRQCPTMADYLRLEQETVGLVSGLQQMCGKGPLPSPTRCLQNLNRNLRDCYTQVGLDPDLFSPKGTSASAGSASKVIGAIIGENEKAATKFCRVKRRLFDCMKRKLDQCPGATEVMALSGFDHKSLEHGIDVLCRYVKDYVKGLTCFQKPTPQVGVCYNTLIEKVTALSMEQGRRAMPLEQFYDRFCQYKIEHMDCDLGAWRKGCERGAVGLKTEFECSLLPTTCKNDQKMQSKLSQTCAKERFERHLRSGATHPVSVSIIATTVFSLMIAFIL